MKTEFMDMQDTPTTPVNPSNDHTQRLFNGQTFIIRGYNPSIEEKLTKFLTKEGGVVCKDNTRYVEKFNLKLDE